MNLNRQNAKNAKFFSLDIQYVFLGDLAVERIIQRFLSF